MTETTATATAEVLTWIAECRHSVVGYSAAAALACDTAIVGNVTVDAGGPVDMSATIAHPNGNTRLFAVDGRWYDRQGIPLAPTDSAIVMVYVDTVLGHRDSPFPMTRADAAVGPVRNGASGKVRALADALLW